MATQTGVISRMGAKGFGFIRPMDESPAVFFHLKDCFLRNTRLQVGDRVEFEVNVFSRRSDGKRTACEVRVIDDVIPDNMRPPRPSLRQSSGD